MRAATLLGCAPNNFVAANAGAHLTELQSMSDLADPRLLALGAAAGAIGLGASLWRAKEEGKVAGAGQGAGGRGGKGGKGE